MIEITFAILLLYCKYRERLWKFSYDDLNSYIEKKEHRLGIKKWAVLLTGILMLALFFYVRPASHCAFMGKHYAQLALDPFAFYADNPVPHRVLTSLISYLIGLRGQLVIITNLFFASSLIWCVYIYFRTKLDRPADAFFASVIIAFSLVSLNTVYYGGYNDSLSYLLIFLIWLARNRKLLFFSLFFLGLLNRESIVFLIPWFLMMSFENKQINFTRILVLAIGFAASLTLYYLYIRWTMTGHGNVYSPSQYLGSFLEHPLEILRIQLPNLGLAFFSVFKLMWIIPLSAILLMWKNKEKHHIVSMVMLIVCSALQLFFAWDTTRLLTLSFMIMPISLLYLFGCRQSQIRSWLIPIFILNLLVPNINVAAVKIDVLHSLISYAILYWSR